jgi:LmbE family N-acetylglucosaminyl deacetylase
VQLGYYCLQLSAMLERSRGDLCFPRIGRVRHPQRALATIRCHCPPMPMASLRGRTCSATLVALLERFRPEIVVTPHPQLDPHPDHYATTLAIDLAAKLASWQPEIALLYANHLHDNDRWPMGPAGCGIALPPAFTSLPADALWSPTLSEAVQLDKAMALAMQHDLQGRLPIKKRLRRRIQQVLTGRS